MKNVVTAFIFFLTLGHAQQKDSLAKYSDHQLLKKAVSVFIEHKTLANAYSSEVLKRNPNDSIKAVVYYHIGLNYFFRNNGNLDTAITTMKKGQYYAEKSNNYALKKLCLQNLAFYYALKNDKAKTLEYFKKAKIMEDQEVHSEYERLKTSGDNFEVYALLGAFSKEVDENKKSIQEIDAFLKSEKTLTKNEIDELNSTKLYLLESIAYDYCFLKKLDSAAIYLQKYSAQERKSLYKFNIINAKILYNILIKKPDAALEILDSVSTKIKDDEINRDKSHLYFKAVCWFNKRDYKKSLAFCKEALSKKIMISGFINYELELYKIAADCAEKLGKTQEEQYYSKLYISISQETNYTQKAALIAKLYEQNDIDPLKKELATRPSNSKILFWGLGLATIFSIYIIFSISRSKNQKKKFLEIIENLKQKSSTNPEAQEIVSEAIFLEDFAVDNLQHSESNIPVGSGINEETEKKILKQLALFEKKQQFLSPSITTGSLAADMGTNVSYLSNIIKTHKKNNFNGYINQLRIDYIIQKINDDPVYLNYTIEYLAEAAGYTSRTTFIRIFKEIKGIPPSKFIEYMVSYN